MEFLRGVVTCGAITVTTTIIPTPVSATEEYGILLHKIMIQPSIPSFSAGIVTLNHHALCSESHDGGVTPGYEDPSLLYRHDQRANEGIVVGASSRMPLSPTVVEFDPPILYTKKNLYWEAERNVAGAGGAEASIAIGYTLEKVSREDFISALVSF